MSPVYLRRTQNMDDLHNPSSRPMVIDRETCPSV
jgi:hypothetical protein